MGKSNAFTLLETLLAVVIATGLLSTAMYFYQQSSRFRNDLILENERIASARLIINRMSSELRSTLTHPKLGIGLKGGSNWIEFLKTSTPSRGSWKISTETTSPSYPETGYRLIRYQLAMRNLISDSLDNEANRKMIESLNLNENIPANEEDSTIKQKQGDAIDRTERRLLMGKVNTNTIATVKIEPVRITEQLKHMQFRYLNNGSWSYQWPGPNPPQGIEISLGTEPLSATNLLEEYTNHVFRRILRIPTTAPQGQTVTTNKVALEEQSASP
jgi:type II secretory pathway pseudopilin PulG